MSRADLRVWRDVLYNLWFHEKGKAAGEFYSLWYTDLRMADEGLID